MTSFYVSHIRFTVLHLVRDKRKGQEKGAKERGKWKVRRMGEKGPERR